MHQLPNAGAIRVPFHQGIVSRPERRCGKMNGETELVRQKRKEKLTAWGDTKPSAPSELNFGQPDRTFFTTELIRLAESGTGAVQRELRRLTSSGLVVMSKQGNQKHFQANSSVSQRR